MSTRFVPDGDPLVVTTSESLPPVDTVRFSDAPLEDSRHHKPLEVTLDHEGGEENTRVGIEREREEHTERVDDETETKHGPGDDTQTPDYINNNEDVENGTDVVEGTEVHAAVSMQHRPGEVGDHIHSDSMLEDAAHHAAMTEAAAAALEGHQMDVRLQQRDVVSMTTPTQPTLVLIQPPIEVGGQELGGMAADGGVVQPSPPVKKKRKTYSTEEERRQARILKNRRTAEESRQRRMKRMKELEEFATNSTIREKELIEENRLTKVQLQAVTESLEAVVNEKNAIIAEKDSEIQRLQEKLQMK